MLNKKTTLLESWNISDKTKLVRVTMDRNYFEYRYDSDLNEREIFEKRVLQNLDNSSFSSLLPILGFLVFGNFFQT